MRTAYSYVRFSNPEQAAGDSLRRQPAHARGHDDTLPGPVRDRKPRPRGARTIAKSITAVNVLTGCELLSLEGLR